MIENVLVLRKKQDIYDILIERKIFILHSLYQLYRDHDSKKQQNIDSTDLPLNIQTIIITTFTQWRTWDTRSKARTNIFTASSSTISSLDS